MNKELKRVSFVVLAMFVALFLSTSLIQVGFADNLKADGRNARTLYASYSVERGAITVDGQPIAQSVPSGDEFKFQRTYPGGEMYAHVSGFLALFGEPTGIEGALNDYLSGRANQQFLDQVNSIITGQSPKGASVELTIDPVVQQAAWDALGGLEGAVVAIDPRTGAILAMVSKPSFDPNSLASHDTEMVEALYQQLLDDPSSPLINRTIQGDLDPPGSTMKVVVAAAALEAGLSPDTQFPNPPSLQLPGSDNFITNSGGDDCGGTATVSIADALRLSATSRSPSSACSSAVRPSVRRRRSSASARSSGSRCARSRASTREARMTRDSCSPRSARRACSPPRCRWPWCRPGWPTAGS